MIETMENIELPDIKKLLQGAPKKSVDYKRGGGETKAEDEIEAFNSKSWRCIDGRDNRGGLLAYPGGALGLFAVLRAVFKEQDSKELLNFFENKMGQITYHTDEHAIEQGKTMACAGCGYAGLLIKHGDEYGLDGNKLLDDIHMNEKDPEKDENAVILQGDHQESLAIIFEKSDKVRLPSGSLQDASAFVCHSAVALKVLQSLAEDFSEEQEVKFDKSHLKQIHKTHIYKTLEHLQEHLKNKFPILKVNI